jgi:protein-disulfide isomerase
MEEFNPHKPKIHDEHSINHKPSTHEKHNINHNPNHNHSQSTHPHTNKPDHSTHPSPTHTTPKIDDNPKIDNEPDTLRIKNPWKLAAIVLGIIALALLYMIYSGNSPTSSISGEDAGKAVTNYLNARTGGGVNYISHTDLGFIYEITVSYQGQNVPVFITKDGEYFVQIALPITADGPPAQQPTNQPSPNQEPIQVSEDDDAVEGQADAPITIIEFSDYECPFCGKFYTETLLKLREQYIETGKAKLIFRDFPLNNIHPNAQKAAEAAECAGQQNKYFEMHDKLFENQQVLDINSLKQYAKDLNLNQQAFDSCLDDGTMADEVAKDLADGTSYGVTGTPGFFINGRPLEGAVPFEAFEQIIKEELEKQ